MSAASDVDVNVNWGFVHCILVTTYSALSGADKQGSPWSLKSLKVLKFHKFKYKALKSL